MATVLVQNGSTAGGAILQEAENTRSSQRVSAFLPRPKERSAKLEGSEQRRPLAQADDTTPDAPTAPDPAPLVRLTGSSALIPRKIRILQQFEGVVEEVQNEEFTAELRNLTVSRSAPEIAEFSTEEVSRADRSLIQRGAVFYWVIGYDTTPAGQIRRLSEIRFRRSPEWSERKLEEIQAQALERFRQLVDDEAAATTEG